MGWLAQIVCGVGLLLSTQATARAEGGDLTLIAAQKLAWQIVPKQKNPDGWGKDIWFALDRNGITPSKSNFCAVAAVIEQESSFVANPEVKSIGRLAIEEATAKIAKLPLLNGIARSVVFSFLENRPDPKKSYLRAIRTAKTERDLDLVARRIVYYLLAEYANVAVLNMPGMASVIEDVNPVKTIGAMQVSMSFVVSEVAAKQGRGLRLQEVWDLRDKLYSRSWGVHFGTRMLLRYRAGYSDRLYVFADYNAGRYSSRNAAFQKMLAMVTGQKISLDGDLLIYESGTPAGRQSQTERALAGIGSGLTEDQIRKDLLLEKRYDFHETVTYLVVAQRYHRRTGLRPLYETLPQIALRGPKQLKSMSTERFARKVKSRYERCMRR